MSNGFLPIYNRVISRKNLLCEKFTEEQNEIWEGHYVLEFSPDSKESSEFLVSTIKGGFPTELLYDKEYISFKINILDNIGVNDGKYFLDWIQSFYDSKNDFYRFNIYDKSMVNISIYLITKSMKKIARFYIPSCVIKNPLFFSYNRNNPESPQFALTICSKQSVTINHFINIANV